MPRFPVGWLPLVLLGVCLAGCATGPKRETAGGKAAAPAAGAERRVYVLLSGGGTPLSNNYSQYLQAKGVSDTFARELPGAKTWTFFGAGNRPDAPPVLADVRRETKIGGRLVQSWLPGVLPANRPATRAGVLKALREEILPAVRDGGTLFLFVGDHGELAGAEGKKESAITLWQLKRNRRGDGWYTDGKEILGVAELRRELAAGLGRGRVVFCMTQCHSGGFHDLGAGAGVALPAGWFAAGAEREPGPAAGPKLSVAGFTATIAALPAAGCVADPDPDLWAGYERFFPEALAGRDLMSGAAKGVAQASFAAAHVAATLVDRTIDQPRATSEHRLEAWAEAVETQLARTLAVTERTQTAVAAYQRVMETGRVTASDPALRAKAEQFAGFTAAWADAVPAARPVLVGGTRAQLEAAREERGGGGPRGAGRRGRAGEARTAWNTVLRPAWRTAVEQGEAPVPAAARAFERALTKAEADGKDFLLRAADSTAMLNEVYWASGYAEPAKTDPAVAAAVTRWAAERRAAIVAWGQASADPARRAAAAKIGPGPQFAEGEPEPMSRKTAVERVLFYRRVLAAWEFLLAMDHREALAEIRELQALEELPVRPAAAGG